MSLLLLAVKRDPRVSTDEHAESAMNGTRTSFRSARCRTEWRQAIHEAGDEQRLVLRETAYLGKLSGGKERMAAARRGFIAGKVVPAYGLDVDSASTALPVTEPNRNR